MIIEAIEFVILIIALSFLMEYIERKIRAKVQQRIGPKYTGLLGILQPFADFLKLIFKEDVTSYSSDWILSIVSTLFLLTSSIALAFFVPFGTNNPIINYEYNLLASIVLITIYSLFVGMLGFSLTGSYETVGVGRMLQQVVSYETPYIISLLIPSLLVGSLNFSRIIEYQKSFPLFLFFPISFVVSLMSIMAKLEKAPFDVPEAETEIGGGWLSEISSWKLASIKLASNISFLVNASIIVDLYLGGSNNYIFPSQNLGVLYFTIKLLFVVFLLTLISSVLARYKIDQVVSFFWKYATPLTILQLILLFLVKMFS
ncbi:MAG: complex I subunit 1 family protein [Thermoproteota archaeon]|nr:NADH-quinone oxidoreductase subunit H [Candidatus Brockarchaeota archaeon]